MNIGLIDASFLFRRNWHAQEHTAEVNQAALATVNEITRLARRFDVVAICTDSPPYWRREVYPEYKANREPASDLMIGQLRSVIDRLDKDGFHILSAKGFEADDVIATAATQLCGDHDVTIVSPDKDCAQLISDAMGITQLSPQSGKQAETVYNEAGILEKFGVKPNQMVDLLALWGDKSDNVPGAPGIGAKKASVLLQQWTTLDMALENAADVKPPSVALALVEHGENIRKSRELVKLRIDAPLDASVILTKKEVKPLTVTNYDQAEREAIEGEPVTEPPPPPAPEPPREHVQIVQHRPAQPAQVTKWSDGLEPTTLAQTFNFAEWIFNSRMFTQFANAQAIGTTIVLGRELGLGAITALNNIHMINGKPAIGAHLIIAMCMESPDCEYFEFLGGDGKSATYETKHRRNKNATKLTYTIEQAAAVGLTRDPLPGKEKGPWLTRPEDMLRKTCGAKIGRIVYPGVACGIYSNEELGHE